MRIICVLILSSDLYESRQKQIKGGNCLSTLVSGDSTNNSKSFDYSNVFIILQKLI